MNQILKRHLHWQTVMYSPGEVTDLRQSLEQQALALFRIPHGPWRKCLRFRGHAQDRHAPDSCKAWAKPRACTVRFLLGERNRIRQAEMGRADLEFVAGQNECTFDCVLQFAPI